MVDSVLGDWFVIELGFTFGLIMGYILWALIACCFEVLIAFVCFLFCLCIGIEVVSTFGFFSYYFGLCYICDFA